jgi:hypothetical protein
MNAKPHLKICILLDPMGYGNVTDDDEYVAHCHVLRTEVLPDFDLTIERRFCFDEAAVDADLVVFDFGGMMPGSNLLGDNSRRLARWISDHPSALVVIPSTFTYRNGLQDELAELHLLADHDRAVDLPGGARLRELRLTADDTRFPMRNVVADDDALNNPDIRRAIQAWARRR